MIEEVERRGHDPQAQVAPEREHDVAHLAHARVGEHPLHVRLPEREERSDHDGERPHDEQDLAAGECRPDGGRDDPQEGEDPRGLGDDPGHEHGHRRRRGGVRVGKPAVERDERSLNEETAQEERRRHPRKGPWRPERCLHLVERDPADREEEERDRREHEDARHRRQDDVLPGALEGLPFVPEGDQDEGRDRGHLDEDVQGEQVPHHGDPVHPDERDEDEVREGEPVARVREGPARNEEGRHADDPGAEKEHPAQMIDREVEPKDTLERREERPVDHDEPLEKRGHGLRGEDAKGDPRRGTAGPLREKVREDEGAKGDEEQEVAHRSPPKNAKTKRMTAIAPAIDQRM